MKSSEEMTGYVIKRLNEHREKVNRRNAFIKKITFGLVDPEQQNALTEKFTDSEEVKGVGFMNKKFSLIATTSSLFMVVAAIISIISLNMGKPNFNDEADMIESLSTSATTEKNSTGTSVLNESVQIVPVQTTVISATYAENKVETIKTAKTTYLVKSTQTTAVRKTEIIKAEEPIQTEEPVQTTAVIKTEIPKTEKPTQTEELVQTTAVIKTEIPKTEKPTQTEEPMQTTISPVADENIEVFQLTPSMDGVDEFMESFREKYGNDRKGNCYNVTPQEITDKYGLHIFKFDYDGKGTLYGDGFLLYENEIYPLGISFGGWGLTSFAVADTDNNGSNELYFTFSWGSGIHRSQLGYFDTQSKKIAEFDYEYWDYDMVLTNENGVLSICHAEMDFTEEEIGRAEKIESMYFIAGEEIGRIEFIDGEIHLALIEN